MPEEFDLLANLPWIVFGVCFLGIFILLLAGGITLLLAGQNSERTQKGRELLFTGLSFMLVLLLITVVFLIVSFVLQKGKVLQPQPFSAEFPVAAYANFPPSVESIAIGSYYFRGPQLLKDSKTISESLVYAILCKQNEQYEPLYVGEGIRRTQPLQNPQYSCWLENCGNNLKNIYFAFLITPKDQYGEDSKVTVRENIIFDVKPKCLDSNN